MSLTDADIRQIGALTRDVIREEVPRIVREETADLRISVAELQHEVGGVSRRIDRLEIKVDRIDGRLIAVESDVKEI